MTKNDLQAVRDVLQKFQDGYDRRDVALVDDFRKLFADSEETEVIGTGGVAPGDDEWCIGPDTACNLVRNDWEGWGDLKLDVAQAHIYFRGDVAWLATTGTVSMQLDSTETYQDHLDYIQKIAAEESMEPQARMLEILHKTTNTMFEVERGSGYVWPIRFTGVLVREGEEWLFHQITFSFATTRFPDVRNL